MTNETVVAVIVSFNGGDKPLRVVDALRDQVGKIVVIDNGSDQRSRAYLSELSHIEELELVFLPWNSGVGYALNLGLELAGRYGFRWMLTMDQDSVPEADMVKIFLDHLRRHPEDECLTPEFDSRGGAGLPAGGSRTVAYAITSGNLVSVSLARKVGGYDDRLFVDGVDFDFSLKLRLAGSSIVAVHRARMWHEIGEGSVRSLLLGRFHTFHSPARRYYSFRNYVALLKTYLRSFPKFIAKLGLAHLFLVVTILVYGKQRRESIRMMVRGVVDGARNRLGPLRD